MPNKIKVFLTLAAICLGLSIGLVGLAQESSVIEEVNLDENVQAEDLGVKEPTFLPDSRLYFLKEWGRGIQSFFAFGRLKKTELEQKFANEKLMELKALVEKGGDPEILKKAIEKYERALEKIQTQAEKIKEKAQNNPEIDKFLDKFIKHQLLHEKILQKLENQVPLEVYQKIKEAREKHLERFGEVMTKLEDRMEKIRERLEKQMEEIKGSQFKNFKNLEILKELEEKVPEEAKEAIQRAQENALKRLQDDLEKMATPDQEIFQEYIEKISGNKEEQLEILEDLKFEFKERMIEARERIIERVQERTCPEIDKPVAGFCSEGRIIVRKDESSCVIEFKCVIPAELEIPTTACITLWDPVCGNDGKTYSNSCFANLAGKEVVYKGTCREKECRVDADCPQPLCAPLGTAMPLCVGVEAKCVEGKCQTVSQ